SHLVDSAYEGIYLVDPETLRYVDVNPRGAKALQFSPDEMRGMSLQLIHRNELDVVRDKIRAVAETQRREQLQVHAVRRDGKRILVDITLSPAPRDGRMLVLAVGRDLSRSMRSRQQIELLNRVLWVLSNTNRAITREHTEEALF